MQGRLTFADENDKKRYVTNADARFDTRLRRIAQRAAAEESRLLVLTGPSGSGKTTAAARIAAGFAAAGKKLYYISLDDFYYDREVNQARADAEGKPIDYESYRAIDLAALYEFLTALRAGRTARYPHFSFRTGKRDGWREIPQGDTGSVLLEGIQAVYPEVRSLYGSDRVPIYVILPCGVLQMGDAAFTATVLRQFRRIVRNCRHRASSAENELEIWERVTENERLNIFPQIDRSKMTVINSMLPYEINVIKPQLERRLNEIPRTSTYKEYADTILEMLKPVEPISAEYLGEDSIYREFVF